MKLAPVEFTRYRMLKNTATVNGASIHKPKGANANTVVAPQIKLSNLVSRLVWSNVEVFCTIN